MVGNCKRVFIFYFEGGFGDRSPVIGRRRKEIKDTEDREDGPSIMPYQSPKVWRPNL
jgi:hypothetical protein